MAVAQAAREDKSAGRGRVFRGKLRTERGGAAEGGRSAAKVEQLQEWANWSAGSAAAPERHEVGELGRDEVTARRGERQPDLRQQRARELLASPVDGAATL